MSRLEFDLSDEDLDRLAERIAARLGSRLESAVDDGWLTTKQAAEHLGMSVDALHKLTAARAVPFMQDGPGARCYFRRADLDGWRRGA